MHSSGKSPQRPAPLQPWLWDTVPVLPALQAAPTPAPGMPNIVSETCQFQGCHGVADRQWPLITTETVGQCGKKVNQFLAVRQ